MTWDIFKKKRTKKIHWKANTFALNCIEIYIYFN